LGGGLVIKPDFTDANYAFFIDVERQQFHHLFSQSLIIGFPRIQADGAKMADTELRRSEPLPANQAAVIIAESINTRPRLYYPKGRFARADEPGIGHGLVVVGSPGNHVDVWIEKPKSLN